MYNETSKEMEGVCPGLKYLNELSVPIIQDTNSVYMMFGHGCDLKEEVWDVPMVANIIQ